MERYKLIIGLTGIHGCGKTTLSEFFENKGFYRVKNPFTFSSLKAREIANSKEKDQISKAFIFLEDRLRSFLDLKIQKKCFYYYTSCCCGDIHIAWIS